MTYLPLALVDPNAAMPLGQALLIAVIGIAVVLVELALITVIILLLSKLIRLIAPKKEDSEELTPAVPQAVAPAPAAALTAPAGSVLPATGAQPKVDLVNVDEPTAAVIMAIVSEESGIELDHLLFKSIKLAEEK